MENKLLTYDEVLEQTDKNRHLLLGNGFSMAYNKERFSFTSLLQSAINKGIIKKIQIFIKYFKITILVILKKLLKI